MFGDPSLLSGWLAADMVYRAGVDANIGPSRLLEATARKTQIRFYNKREKSILEKERP